MKAPINFTEYYNHKIEEITRIEILKKQNRIFVLIGQGELIENQFLAKNITDPATFTLNGNDSLFDQKWATDIFVKLQVVEDFHFLSYPQFVYLIHYFNMSLFDDRIIILKDNLRQLFPINRSEFIEKAEAESIEQRPDNLPIYQAEQLQLEDNFFYSVKMPDDDYRIINIFKDKKDLTTYDKNELEIIDISSDDYALDYFINKCIRENNFASDALVKRFSKQPISTTLNDTISIFNSLLSLFGGGLFLKFEETIKEEYVPSELSTILLKSYWGNEAQFRSLNVYLNPDVNNQITEISQGLIVDTIIAEYQKTKKNIKARDLFLTAPTGAGKSLLFQLPSFYVSNNGDVTIVVSPLIALMKDQVSAIIQDRGFEKVAYINSELSLIDRDRIIENCKKGEIDVLYMSPELLMSYHISHFIGERNLGLLVIDEAHLITTWGRDFRVDYWFLGNHIRKIRKYSNMNFPMVAVTATAIYGGANDMVFDSIDSLIMHNPHIFIGQVKRENITFLVNNYEKFEKSYVKSKLNQTVEFIKEVNKLGLKALVYTPYTKHIRDIQLQLSSEDLDIAAGYYGSLPADQKELSFSQFKSGEKKIMVSTKAFGMGVDISDIELVYHHAPSGLLPDYVQEIGRVARKSFINGFAALNYASQDQAFSKALHGMSAIREYQLKEVLKKINKAYYKNKKSRNLLLSVDDFGHIFEDPLSLDQKVLTSLMMIEKDYLAKHRFNVLIARPKKMFVQVYARVSDNDLAVLELKYKNTFHRMFSLKNGYNVIELDLDKLWYLHFNEMSFPVLKYKYYKGILFKDDIIELTPQLKISFERLDNFDKIYRSLENLFDVIKEIFSSFDGSYFNQKDFQEKLYILLSNQVKASKIADFILSTYSGRVVGQGLIEGNAFLQRRRSKESYMYRVFNTRYLGSFASVLNKFNKLFDGSDKSIENRYVTNKGGNTEDYIRLGYFLEILELGTFEIKGGENPMVFIRINDPERIERDSQNDNYSNTLLKKTLDRHYLSNEIFDHFFLRSFDNKERWDFIEDYFLGSDVDSLINKHPGREEKNNIDIVKYLKENTIPLNSTSGISNRNNGIHIFQPNPEIYYGCNVLLTIEIDEEPITMKINKWLSDDPVSLHKTIVENGLKVDNEVFKILVSKLRSNHYEYFKDFLGLNMKISFDGYDYPIKAIVPYSNKPVLFYKWWCNNKNTVKLSFKEKLELFDKVNLMDSSVLKSKHKKLLDF